MQAIAPGCSVLAISAMTGDALDILTAMLDGTIVLIGPSGAGKSTLANALIGAEVLATNAVCTVDGKGRHTTVHRELFPLPSGGALIDTPGLRGIGLWDAADGIELASETSSPLPGNAGSATAAMTPNQGAGYSRRSNRANCRSAASRATESCCARTNGWPRDRTPDSRQNGPRRGRRSPRRRASCTKTGSTGADRRAPRTA